MILRLSLIACAMAGTVAAQNVPPESSPSPPMRPDPEMQVPQNDPEASADPEMAEARAQGEGVRDLLAEDDQTLSACLAELDAIGTVYDVGPSILEEGDADCGIVNVIEVQQILPGVAVRPDAKMRCETALAMAQWTQDMVQTAASVLDRGPVTAIEHGSTYACRRRNNLPEGKLSEHAFGNAVDVMGFRFGETGETLRIEPRAEDGTIEEAFQRTARASACLYFTTVLGPGADAYHDDHIHVDVKERDGEYRLCQ